MENVPHLKCACGNCGEVIDYLPGAVGTIVQCPRCGEKSRLPEPPPFQPAEGEPPFPDVKPARMCPVCAAKMDPYGSVCGNCEARRRRVITLVVGLVSALVVLAIGWLFLKKFISPPRQSPAAQPVLHAPSPRLPKSINDLKPGKFWLEPARGSALLVAVGDINNASQNLHLRLRVDLDVLDARGAKIGTVTGYLNELLPGKTWRFIETVKDPRAKSLRFASLKEDQ